MEKIATCLWFDTQAEEAARFYTSLFDDSKILEVSYYTEAGPGEPGSVLTVRFQLAGQPFLALNGGPQFQFNEAVSLYVECEDQAEVDRLWAALTEGGEESWCGWLKDRYGVSWQIIPKIMPRLLNDPDREKAARVMQTMLKMHKIDIQALQDAYQG